MSDLLASLWPGGALGDVLDVLARRSGLAREGSSLPFVEGVRDLASTDAWIARAAAHLDVEATNVSCTAAELESFLAAAAPALLFVQHESRGKWLAILGSARGRSVLLGPDGEVRRVDHEDVRELVCAPVASPLTGQVDAMLDGVGIHGAARVRARRALVYAHVGSSQVGVGWVLRPQVGTGVWRHVRHGRLPGPLLGFLVAHVTIVACTGVSWWLVGRGALQGRLDPGWLSAWALLVVTLVPVGAAASWLRGLFSIRVGCLLKQWLLVGALQLDQDALRHEGAGRSLSRVVESSALGSLTLSTVLAGIVSVVELVFAVWVLSMGAGGWLHASLLAFWVAVTAVCAWRLHAAARTWTGIRLHMTHELVERMMGHRTRLAQEEPGRWHEGEDESLDRYLGVSEKMDGASMRFSTWIPRGWVILGVLGLGPAFVQGQAQSGALAVALGGVMLASQALGSVSGSLTSLISALMSWEQASVLVKAAQRRQKPASMSGFAAASNEEGTGRVVLEADHVTYCYPTRAEPVLKGCSLEVREGDRILLQGASGSGKSTLVSVLSGLRVPDAGLLLLGGLDRQTLGGQAWRRRVVMSPQFHENYLLTATLGFNLLMGRGWPASADDLAEAEAVCREIGLGELLDRMPAGLNQVVGETGWRLSHGEMSRVFLARGILQGGDVLLFDESFAALDPVNLERGLRCALARAKTLVVVAHP